MQSGLLACEQGCGSGRWLNQELLQMRREGRIQLFDDGGDPLIIKVEQTN